MKRLLIITAAVTLTAMSALADTVTLGGGASFLSTSGFSGTTGTNTNPSTGTPFWNNFSTDGLNQNAGYFLTGTGAFSTNYLGTTPVYAGTAPSTTNATSFSFLRDASSINVALLYSSASTNNVAGNEIGLYDTSNINSKTVISSSLPNSGQASYGAFNTPASYGFYATVCFTVGTCNTFYTQSGNNTGGLSNQHFALFRDNATSQTQLTYFIALERLSPGPSEGYGDFNDLIIQVTTGENVNPVPEPATLSFVGLALVGLGFVRNRKRS